MNWNKSLVAIRSLRSKHHAANIEPQVIDINWNLGKRCNYDCSYCSPTIHDWVSPHLLIETIQNFLDQISEWTTSQNKSFTMSLTGGEPFVHPRIIEILKIIKQSNSYGDRLTCTTNGSLPLELYERALDYLTHLTISLHLERSDSEVLDTLNKAIALQKKYPTKWINVQVMCLPGKLDFIERSVMPLLESQSVRFTLRRIRPWLNESVGEWKETDKTQILKTQYHLQQQTAMKEEEKQNLDKKLKKIYESEDYYTSQELDWLQRRIPKTTWQNVGIWNEDLNYFETNSDTMVSNNGNQFLGWSCFVGLDSLFIDFDGLLYRGVCHNDGPIGRLGEQINFAAHPTVCKKQWCISNVDQTVRKARTDHLNLITKTV
jgi:MoaA/NifB/PqqE/SkfB family radical SAM enzyme